MKFLGTFTAPAIFCCSVFLVGSTWASSAAAEEDATRVAARLLGTEGVNAYLDEEYGLAHERLESAYAVLRVPSLALWSARALEKNGKLVEASERYLEATQLEIGSEGNLAVQKQAQKDAAVERAALLLRIPSVTVKLRGRDPAAVELSLGGEPILSDIVGRPRPTNPGQTEIIAKSGDVARRQLLDLSEGQSEEVLFEFPPDKGEPTQVEEPFKNDDPSSRDEQAGGRVLLGEDSTEDPSRAWQVPVGWAGIGVGAAGIVLGAVTGVLALSASKKFDCEDNYCPDATDKEISAYNTERAISSIGFVAGGVIAGAGLTLLLSAPRKEGVSASAFFAPSSVGVRGNF